MLRLALFEPDIPQNTGTLLRTAACLGIVVDLIEPCGFLLSDRHLRRAGLDYLNHVSVVRHPSWEAYLRTHGGAAADRRLVLLTTRGNIVYTSFQFARDDTILVGRESSGVPQAVHDAVDARVRIPTKPGMRSLNVAVAAAMVIGEALRQTGGFAETRP